MYDKKSDEEESSSNDYTGYSDNTCFSISKLWIEKSKLINTDYSVTDWMVCVIPQIRDNVFKRKKKNSMNQVKKIIKTLYDRSSENHFHENLDAFWTEYKTFNHKNDPFESDEVIWSSKYIRDGNSHLWHQKYSLPSTIFFGFAACRVTSNFLRIGSVDR